MQIEIEKMVYGGDGLGRMPADAQGRGKTVFVPFVLPSEQVEVTVIESRSGFARAKLDKVLTPSPERNVPGCPYFGGCGGCHYQHMTYEAQLRHKAEILRETLRRTAKLELQNEIQLHPSPPWNYRNRSRMHVRHTPEFALGYYRDNSHDVLAVESCPISSPLINQAIAAVAALGREKTVPECLHGMQFFANHDDTQLLVEAYVQPGSNPAKLQPLAATLHALLPPVLGVVVFPAAFIEGESRQRTPLTTVYQESAQAIGGNSLTYDAVRHQYRVSGGSFFQTNRYLVDTLAEVATAGGGGRAALDLYAGVGLFTLLLARKFDQVLAVESSPNSFADLRLNVPANAKCIRSTTERFLAERGSKLAPDLILVDPPRAGLGEKTAVALGRMSANRVTYVSCDPATLSRDLRLLLELSFRVEQAHLVDMFPQTFHMETILHLAR